MEIRKDGDREWLSEGKIEESPNKGGAFQPGARDTVVIHFTAGRSAEASAAWLRNPEARASVHMVVGRDGSIDQLVPLNVIAWHAGRSAYQGRSGFNKYSIGIELDNAGRLEKSGNEFTAWFGRRYSADEVVEALHRNETTPAYWHRYSEKQIETTEEICRCLIAAFDLKLILGHEEISPGRKQDPGPAFPLDKLRDRLLGPTRDEEDAPLEPTPAAASGLVTASQLNIRSAPSSSSPTAAPPLQRGTIVDILNEREGWYEVRVTTHGWVSKDYVRT